MFKNKRVKQPGINIKFGIDALHHKESGRLMIKASNKNTFSRTEKEDEVSFSIIEPITGVDQLDERLIHQIFQEAINQDIKPIALIQFNDRYFSRRNEPNFDPKNNNLVITEVEDLEFELGIKVVRPSKPQEDPYTVRFGLSQVKSSFPLITPEFVSYVFHQTRLNKFIPISLECLLVKKQEPIDESLEFDNSNIKTIGFPHYKESYFNIPTVIRRREKGNS